METDNSWLQTDGFDGKELFDSCCFCSQWHESQWFLLWGEGLCECRKLQSGAGHRNAPGCEVQ